MNLDPRITNVNKGVVEEVHIWGQISDNFYFSLRAKAVYAKVVCIQMSTYNICFYGEMEKIIPEFSLNTPPLQVLYVTKKLKINISNFLNPTPYHRAHAASFAIR